MTAKHMLGPVVGLALYASPALAGLVNVDVNGPGGATHAGANGALSTTGTRWNGVAYNVDAPGLLDEFGASTSISLVYLRTKPLGPFMDFAALNNLQNDGVTGEGFEIRGLDPNLRYTLAVYSTANATFNLVDAAGNHGGRCSDATPTYVLPGQEGRDYCRFVDLVPFVVASGSYGIRLSGLVGAVSGWQLLGTPPPDVTSPSCSGTVQTGTPGSVDVQVQDSESGLASIELTASVNVSGSAPSVSPGTRDEIVFILEQVDPYETARVEVTSWDVAGNSSTCTFEIPAGTRPDVTAPTCSGESFDGPPAGVRVGIQDGESGLASIAAVSVVNANVTVPAIATGTHEVVTVEITQIDPYQVARVELTSRDVTGNEASCVFEIAAGTPPPPEDTEPPLCSGRLLEGPPQSLEITVVDGQSGLASIELVSGDNVLVNVPEVSSGTRDPVVFTVTKADPNLLARIEIASSDLAGHRSTCVFEIPADPVEGPCQNPEGCCEETMGFFAAQAQAGQLTGNGPGNSGLAHRRIFERQLDRICSLIDEGNLVEACRELAVAIRRVDGAPSPGDFVVGPSAPQMVERLRDLQTKLGCGPEPTVTSSTSTRSGSVAMWRESVSWGVIKSLYDTSQ